MTLETGAGAGRGCWREYLSAGILGGAGAGFLVAYCESVLLLLTVGTFWVDWTFLARALALYGLAGGFGGAACSLVFFFAFFRRRPLRSVQPRVFFLAVLFALALVAEVLVYLFDIHTFRNLRGGWTSRAYIVLFLGLLTAGLAGWLIARAGRRLSRGSLRGRLLRGAGILSALAAIFLLARIFTARQEGAGPGRAREPGEAPPVNFIIMLADSLRPDHLSAYGYPLPTSPAIDRLAREGVLFEHGYAASNWTVPTHASLFTGLYPSSHGCYSLYSTLDAAVPTLAQILSNRGYLTGGFPDNRLLGSRYGLMRGFQKILGVDNEHKVSLALLRVADRLTRDRSSSGNILRIAGKWIEWAAARKKPYFLFFNFMDTHLPYRPRHPYIREFLRSAPDRGVDRKLALKFTTDEINTKKAANELYPRMTAADWNWLGGFYDSNIRALDEQIGGFLARLKKRGLLANTVIVVTADHGEFFGEGGIGGHLHSSMNDAGLRIPLIVWGPGRLPPARIGRAVSQVDLFPTLLKLAGLADSIPRTVQGQDLFAPPAESGLLAEFWDDIRGRFSRALIAGNFKLVVPVSGPSELYDWRGDPQERSDLARLRPDLLNALGKLLDERLRSMPRRKSGEDGRKRKEMEGLLRSLGYL